MHCKIPFTKINSSVRIFFIWSF